MRLSREQSSLGAMLLNMAWPIAATVAGLLLLAAGLSVRLARQITQPINAISPDDPQDVYPELQPLTQRLRQQRETIRNQMDELSRRMREFSAMTENMSEGFLLIDLRGHVLTENHSASMLLPTDADNIAKCSQRELCQAAQQALTGQRCERLLQQGERTLSVIASPRAGVRPGHRRRGADSGCDRAGATGKAPPGIFSQRVPRAENHP